MCERVRGSGALGVGGEAQEGRLAAAAVQNNARACNHPRESYVHSASTFGRDKRAWSDGRRAGRAVAAARAPMARGRAARGGKRQKSCGHRFAAGVTSVGTVAGLVATVYCGIALLKAPDAGKTFRTLSSKCVVTGVYHEQTYRSYHSHASKKTVTQCYDDFTYEFAWCQDGSSCAPVSAPTSASATTPRAAGYTPPWSSTAVELACFRDWWTSFPPPAAFANAGWEPELLVSEPHALVGCSGALAGSPHQAGDAVTCYQPTVAPTALDAAYTCANPSCIKLMDPADEAAIVLTGITEGLWFGVGTLLFFGAFWLCGWWSHGFSCRAFFCGDDMGDDEHEGARTVHA